MSLLHRQIAARRQPPLALPRPVNRLLTFVAGEMSAPPLRAAVGSSEMPADVSAGLPSARATVRVYAERLDGQIEKIHQAWQAWLKEKIAAGKALTDDMISFDVDWPAFYSQWKNFYISIQSFNPIGPSPAEAWGKIQTFDDQCEALRRRFAAFTTDTVTKAPDAQTDLGNQPSALGSAVDKASSFVKTAAIAVGVVGAVVVGIEVFRGFRASPSA